MAIVSVVVVVVVLVLVLKSRLFISLLVSLQRRDRTLQSIDHNITGFQTDLEFALYL